MRFPQLNLSTRSRPNTHHPYSAVSSSMSRSPSAKKKKAQKDKRTKEKRKKHVANNHDSSPNHHPTTSTTTDSPARWSRNLPGQETPHKSASRPVPYSYDTPRAAPHGEEHLSQLRQQTPHANHRDDAPPQVQHARPHLSTTVGTGTRNATVPHGERQYISQTWLETLIA